MRYDKPLDDRTHCGPLPRRLTAALALCAMAFLPALANERWLVHGLLDGELWETDSGSRLLSKNDGDTASSGHLRLWVAGQPHERLHLVAVGRLDGGESYESSGSEANLEQAFLRYSFRRANRLFLEAGKIVMPIGDFTQRYLSTVNPLIGAPSSYSVSYPLGVQLAGSVSKFDFRVALVDEPLTNVSYLPESDSAARPAVSFGVTPMIGLRFGGYYTQGPYLNEDVVAPGGSWKDFEQRIVGVDCQFSRGHFDLHADFNASNFEVPTVSDTLRGDTFYVDSKYTWSPRVFTALRLESNNYVFARPFGGFWVAREIRVDDVEAGVGYRFARSTLLKLSYRFDHWHTDDSLMFPDGHSLALQISQSFDVIDWFDRPR